MRSRNRATTRKQNMRVAVQSSWIAATSGPRGGRSRGSGRGAVAHGAEMEGRLEDGIDWIASLASEWSDCSNFALHLKWHESLYHLELEQHDRVLAL